MWQDLNLSFSLDDSGDIAVDTNVQAIKNSLRNILLTIPGTRRRNPTFAFGVQKYISEFLDDENYETIKSYIISYISKYENRAVVSGVTVTKTSDEKGFQVVIAFYPVNEENSLSTYSFVLKGN